ncbi:MAG: hypothetical protein IT204_18230 [Fimbriimonadaceae bacterium]|nr:hypothetical protein [Fimbriimonadaceae bacterium]
MTTRLSSLAEAAKAILALVGAFGGAAYVVGVFTVRCEFAANGLTHVDPGYSSPRYVASGCVFWLCFACCYAVVAALPRLLAPLLDAAGGRQGASSQPAQASAVEPKEPAQPRPGHDDRAALVRLHRRRSWPASALGMVLLICSLWLDGTRAPEDRLLLVLAAMLFMCVMADYWASVPLRLLLRARDAGWPEEFGQDCCRETCELALFWLICLFVVAGLMGQSGLGSRPLPWLPEQRAALTVPASVVARSTALPTADRTAHIVGTVVWETAGQLALRVDSWPPAGQAGSPAVLVLSRQQILLTSYDLKQE